MKTKLILAILLSINTITYSQPTFTAYNKIKFSIGTSGQSIIVWLVPQNESFQTTALPVLQASYDFVQKNDISIGAAISYQNFQFHIKQKPLYADLDMDKLSIGLRASYVIIDQPSNAVYIGGRWSLNLWSAQAKGTIDLKSYNLNTWQWTYIRLMINKLIDKIEMDNNSVSYSQTYSWLRFPLQFHIGYEHYFTKHLGYNFEAALGSPYLFLSSLTLKF